MGNGRGRAENPSNLPLLPTPVLLFLPLRLFLSEGKSLIDSAKGRELAFPYETGTSPLMKGPPAKSSASLLWLLIMTSRDFHSFLMRTLDLL